MKTGWRKIMGTFGDISFARDEPSSPSASARSETSRRSTLSFTGGKSRKKDKEEIIRLLTDLGDERKRTLELQERLQNLLSTNTEVRAAAAIQVDEERRLRRVAEARIRDAKSRLARAEKALITSESQKDSLEAELMEAASEVIAQEAVQKAYLERMEGERAAWHLLERSNEERTQLEKRLKASETQRLNLLKAMAALKNESEHWGAFFDLMQAEKPGKNGSKPAVEPGRHRETLLPPIVENEGEEPAPEATSQKNQEAANSDSTQQADCVVDDEISFIPPKRSSSPLSMNGQEHSKEMPPHPMTPGKLPLAKPTDILEGASDSDTSTESISLADNLDQSGMISLSDYIVSVKH